LEVKVLAARVRPPVSLDAALNVTGADKPAGHPVAAIVAADVLAQ
jgi:hypothetical protein